MTPSPCWREPISWVISWGSPSRGNKIAWRCSTFTTTPVMPRRSMIDLDDYNIRTLAQLMWSASSNQVRISIGPTSTQLKSQLRSHISSYSGSAQMPAQISTRPHRPESWIHSSNPHQPRSPHELKIHPNMRAQSLTTVSPPANHSYQSMRARRQRRQPLTPRGITTPFEIFFILLFLMVLGPPRALLGGWSGNQRSSRNQVMMKCAAVNDETVMVRAIADRQRRGTCESDP